MVLFLKSEIGTAACGIISKISEFRKTEARWPLKNSFVVSGETSSTTDVVTNAAT
jgi:hypothetical protein